MAAVQLLHGGLIGVESVRLCAVVMASGRGRRFGSDKLAYVLNGKSMLRRALDAVPAGHFSARICVARTPWALREARAAGFGAVRNGDTADDPAVTIRLGLAFLPVRAQGVMFLVADQPWLRPESVARLAEAFCREPDKIHALGCGGRRGNPVIFPAALIPELAALRPGQTGRAVIANHPDLLRVTEAESQEELRDVDRPEDLS